MNVLKLFNGRTLLLFLLHLVPIHNKILVFWNSQHELTTNNVIDLLFLRITRINRLPIWIVFRIQLFIVPFKNQRTSTLFPALLSTTVHLAPILHSIPRPPPESVLYPIHLRLIYSVFFFFYRSDTNRLKIFNYFYIIVF